MYTTADWYAWSGMLYMLLYSVSTLPSYMSVIDLEETAARLGSLTTDNDSLFNQKSRLETELAQVKTSLTNELSELKSQLELVKQQLASKEEVETKAREDLRQATLLNEEVILLSLSLFSSLPHPLSPRYLPVSCS